VVIAEYRCIKTAQRWLSHLADKKRASSANNEALPKFGAALLGDRVGGPCSYRRDVELDAVNGTSNHCLATWLDKAGSGLFARHLAIVSRPVNAELDGEQPLDLGREYVLAMVRRLGIVAGLAVVPGFAFGFVSPVELVDSLR
jgi:hypothetical protein